MKNKILVTSMIGIAVAIVSIIAVMFATGKFDSLKKDVTAETATSAVTETTSEAPVTATGRPKSQRPETVVASVCSSYSENSMLELALFEGMGFNTVIYELTADNSETVAPLLAEAKNKSLYHGIKADASQGTDYITAFIEENNLDFTIYSLVVIYHICNRVDKLDDKFSSLIARSCLCTEDICLWCVWCVRVIL